jgi:hypothetical protein
VTPPSITGAAPQNSSEIDNAFESYIARSQTATRSAQGRPNALLFIGGIVSFSGLIFFFLTLPGSHLTSFSISGVSVAIPESTTPVSQATSGNLWTSLIQNLPRLLMLAFIQVLAGFFLRQYRAAMEDFRYYEAVLRNREAQYLAFLIRKTVDHSTPKGKSLIIYSNDLMKEREFGVLRQGQTTASLASLAAEQNDMATIYEKIADMFSALGSRISSSSEKKLSPQRKLSDKRHSQTS